MDDPTRYYVTASIALLVIGAHKLPLHDKAVALEEDINISRNMYLYSRRAFKVNKNA
jgi:hypothetical protein